MSSKQAVIDKWIKNNIDVRTQFESIHDFLPSDRDNAIVIDITKKM